MALKTKGTAELEGLQLPAWRLVLVTDREFFGQHALAASGYVRRRRKAASRTVDPGKMQPGDFVVHRNHGVGKFLKLEKLAIGGESRDYLVVQYADGLLRVAADQLGSLGRYRASTDAPPELNRMGGTAWAKAKERAKKAVRKVAVDLVKLYAERHQAPGFAFPADGPWQHELEDSFPYEPTPDQVKAIADVKRDMEQPQPMDRLVCGDVGFGKTEVAIRAIFKAVTAGKQVAMLAPTTVLAQQHWRSLSERFAPYPMKVSLLNRFRTTAERKTILEGLGAGTVDVVVGTHQLLSKNTGFKQLGLLVVDEEQRFGVNQKEKIKALRKDVDVLTLSATPIPRTLYMSLSGVREMSLITTPPPLRRLANRGRGRRWAAIARASQSAASQLLPAPVESSISPCSSASPRRLSPWGPVHTSRSPGRPSPRRIGPPSRLRRPRAVIASRRWPPPLQSPPKISPPCTARAWWSPSYTPSTQAQEVLAGATSATVIPTTSVQPIAARSERLAAAALQPTSAGPVVASLKCTPSTSTSVLTTSCSPESVARARRAASSAN